MKSHKYGAKADDILLFAYVVEAGSFSKVAEQLALSNSVVSKRIARLEKALNVQLLYRSTRKLSLTDAGLLLYQKSRLAKSAIQEAEEAVTGYGEEVRGNLKITLPVVSARIILNTAIAEFCLTYPDIHVEITAENRMVDIIKEGFDLAIRTAHLEDSTLIARRLIDSQWVICASPGYVKNSAPLVSPTDLEGHNCLVYRYEGAGQDLWALRTDDQEEHIQVSGSLNGNDLDILRQAALTGLGVAYLPKIAVHEDIKAGRLVPLLENHVGKRLGIYAVYPRTRLPDARVKLLIEHLRKAYWDRQEAMF